MNRLNDKALIGNVYMYKHLLEMQQIVDLVEETNFFMTQSKKESKDSIEDKKLSSLFQLI